MTAKFFFGNLCRFIFYYYLCTRLNRKNAQMAESVDALVSNTSGAIHPGSSPGLGTMVGYQKKSKTSKNAGNQ